MAALLKCSFLILLASLPTLVPVGAEWIIAPRQLKENHDYTGLAFIARIRSDKENHTRILYYLSGPGVDQPPVGQFGVDTHTGYVKIFTTLDREKIPFYTLTGIAKYHDGTRAEKDIELKITVLDENDNPPVIIAQQVGYVEEHSASGTVVMRVIATDADQENTINSKIFYRIKEESNREGIFFINCNTGEVIVQKSAIDREIQGSYKLVIEATDFNGLPGGNVGSGEIEIQIRDINDNIPTLEHESYEGSIEENTINVEVMRIKAIDLDLIHTDNWLAAYKIVSGNEGGYFSITTDAKTNEGIIMINKALDYEELKVLNLQIAVANKAEYNFGTGGIVRPIPDKSYPIKINVVNQKEGPRFQPTTKVVTISEDRTAVSLYKVIANYAAIDSDTLKIATNVRYAKIFDEDNWLIIDEKTGDIKLNKFPDRESKFLKNGTYYSKIICITNESPSKTATGTIAIQVEDFNDDCPKLISTTSTMCLDNRVFYATAVDQDEFPNSVPFDFTVIQDKSEGKWTVEHLNETTVILRDHAHLWPGIYKVAVEIKDQQGVSCDTVQMIDVTVCTCQESTGACVLRRKSTARFGAAGILLLLLGLLLLLLLPLLLLFCLCGGPAAVGDFKAIPFETKQHLISYHTEGQGEDKDIPLIQVPGEVDGGTVNARDVHSYGGRGQLGGGTEVGGLVGAGATIGHVVNRSTLNAENMHMYRYRHYSGHEEMDHMGAGMMTGQDYSLSHYSNAVFNGMALPDQFLEEYYSSKSNHAAQHSHQTDGVLVYDYEGEGSPAGSVGCCSLLENDDDLSFLNDLGPKFKTLAEICQGSTVVTESVDTRVSFPPVRPVSPARPSTSTHTHVHTHSETIRDRDHVNTVNTSNLASGSSTFVHEERITERSQGAASVPTVHVQDNVVIPTQTLLVQQPVYYTTAPMYVVESKPQVMLVAGGAQQAVASVGQVGMSHGMVQVGGLQGSQGVVLVDRQVGMGGQGLTKGTLSRSKQVLVVENKSSTGGEHDADLAQGFIQTGQSSAEQSFEVRSQGLQVKTQSFSQSSHSSAGSHEDLLLTATPNLQGSQRVVVQQKKVSVTERNVESSTRA